MCRALGLRVAYTGELGWELHHPIEMQNYLFDRLMEAGEAHGLKLCGSRAQNWLRQEKSYRAWGAELGRDATPLEAGLDRFVAFDKVEMTIGTAGQSELDVEDTNAQRTPQELRHARSAIGAIHATARAASSGTPGT